MVSKAAVACHVQVAEPTITGFKVEGAKITLTVNAVDATLDYFIVPGKSPRSSTSSGRGALSIASRSIRS